MNTLRFRAALLSLAMLAALLLVWQLATLPTAKTAKAAMDEEYAMLMGKSLSSEQRKANGFPTPAEFSALALKQLSDPFYDRGPNEKGIGIQLAHSLGRVAIGYLIALLVAIPLGFAIGMSPLLYRALDPFIQVLKPISPLAWMPIALYTIKDSSVSAIFVIFICSVWPMLINTAFGVAAVRKDWLNVARTLEVSPLRKAFMVVLPAAAPTIITGMRISMGIAWLVIVAAEMLIGGTGIGYFVWNEWNNLSLSNVIFAVLMIGVMGMLLDLLFATLQKKVTYAE
ncbi:nitrate ABC transporter permease [Pseudomonas sp. GD03842]|uniref:nitrate ABC transporter permease n=1 Tax=unclassified Pseudomonas TaxID=196821 RepID=UPI000D357A29|nr:MULTISPECIES: nitrate ABC transporter permease [unclassified Pseudomonas]MDH0746061.1 nitrate ABC transporter permease [Pseudomonas sp. GD03842]RAU48520.1 nitrate ABC transporter, permease protein [Pseudomonas sp. RIT 409]RAU54352.1 nitrate ABC transporter, permease protein [Pseudomonas sp. RIT 412]